MYIFVHICLHNIFIYLFQITAILEPFTIITEETYCVCHNKGGNKMLNIKYLYKNIQHNVPIQLHGVICPCLDANNNRYNKTEINNG
jgi:hypothetical protein